MAVLVGKQAPDITATVVYGNIRRMTGLADEQALRMQAPTDFIIRDHQERRLSRR